MKIKRTQKFVQKRYTYIAIAWRH